MQPSAARPTARPIVVRLDIVLDPPEDGVAQATPHLDTSAVIYVHRALPENENLARRAFPEMFLNDAVQGVGEGPTPLRRLPLRRGMGFPRPRRIWGRGI